jgi:hypothetical protein
MEETIASDQGVAYTPIEDEHGASSRLRKWVATLTGPVFIYSGASGETAK